MSWRFQRHAHPIIGYTGAADMTDLNYTPPARKPIPKGLRFDVLNRDGFKCVYCGAVPPDVVLHLDHKIPVARGGTNELANLVTACLPCNIGKGVKIVGEKRQPGEAVWIARPQIEFFWQRDTAQRNRMVAARCVEWLPDQTPYGGIEYSRLCDTTMLTHGHSCRGFSPYEAAMYAVDILTSEWSSFARYIAFIDDLNIAAEAGHLPQYVAPHILRGLHAETVYSRCGEKPKSYEAISDSVALQSVAAFQRFIDSQHTLWKDAK